MKPLPDKKPGYEVSWTNGFTLIELLVVIAIIGILVALLIPAVQAAREAARRMQCGNNIKQLAAAALNHESAHKIFPTGGWGSAWLGHPDRGFDNHQPGGWIYNILPYIEQQSLHDLGMGGNGISIEDANAIRIATPLAGLNCPARRSAKLFDLSSSNSIKQFRLTAGTITKLARSDYAINGGDYFQGWSDSKSPATLADGDKSNFKWDDMSKQTGISYLRSQIKMSDITDGTSNTFLIGEKYINSYHYLDGKDQGDSETMYCADHLDLIRWTGYTGGTGTASSNNLPRRDRLTIGEGATVQWFGSAHASSFNMSFCDGSVHSINYSVDPEIYRRFGNRKDSLPISGNY
jgi:prepilin-type N-terminal cleavage/methylation domain-containing protein/prepilin-type processing-associated H-X9-DG protein